TEIAGSDDDDRPVLGEAQLARHLVDQVVDVVADAAGAIGAEGREVLAELRRVHPGRCSKFFARHGRDITVRQRVKGAQIEREASEGRLRDTLQAALWPRSAGHTPATPGGSARGRDLFRLSV